MKLTFRIMLLFTAVTLLSACSETAEQPEVKVQKEEISSPSTLQESEETNEEVEEEAEGPTNKLTADEKEAKFVGDSITGVIGKELVKYQQHDDNISELNKNFFIRGTNEGQYPMRDTFTWKLYTSPINVVNLGDNKYDAEVEVFLGYFEKKPTETIYEVSEKRQYTVIINGNDVNVESFAVIE